MNPITEMRFLADGMLGFGKGSLLSVQGISGQGIPIDDSESLESLHGLCFTMRAKTAVLAE